MISVHSSVVLNDAIEKRVRSSSVVRFCEGFLPGRRVKVIATNLSSSEMVSARCFLAESEMARESTVCREPFAKGAAIRRIVLGFERGWAKVGYKTRAPR